VGTTIFPPPRRLLDAVVVGAGPAGIFAALRAARSGGWVLVIDCGPDLNRRAEAGRQGRARESMITSGFGGAGLFSDGKLCLSPRIGSTISNRFPAEQVAGRHRRIDAIIRGGQAVPLDGADAGPTALVAAAADAAGLEYLHYPVRHVGGDRLPHMLARLRRRLAVSARVACDTRCQEVVPASAGGFDVTLEGRLTGRVRGRNVVLAPGKVGAGWLAEAGTRLGLAREAPATKLGLRLEGPREYLRPLARAAADPKLIWHADHGAEVRTHCVCFGGDVVAARYGDLMLAGGDAAAERGSDRSNCALLAAPGGVLPVTPPLARDLVRRINDSCGGRVMAQRLSDFMTGAPTRAPVAEVAEGFSPSLPDAAPGDFTTAFPAPVVGLLRAFVVRLAALCPAALCPGNVMYGPAVERWAYRFTVTDEMEAPSCPGLFLAGDGPGLTGGIIGAADSGWLAGDAVAARQVWARRREPRSHPVHDREGR